MMFALALATTGGSCTPRALILAMAQPLHPPMCANQGNEPPGFLEG